MNDHLPHATNAEMQRIAAHYPMATPAERRDYYAKRTSEEMLKIIGALNRAKHAAALQAEHDAVNHPAHYTSHPSGVECVTIAEHFGFNIGNVIKYLWRCEEKGAPIQDLEKAAWYLNREIAKRKGTE
jgi:ATP-dependent RNA circularization protein (DNA/RNA ligase family)